MTFCFHPIADGGFITGIRSSISRLPLLTEHHRLFRKCFSLWARFGLLRDIACMGYVPTRLSASLVGDTSLTRHLVSRNGHVQVRVNMHNIYTFF